MAGIDKSNPAATTSVVSPTAPQVPEAPPVPEEKVSTPMGDVQSHFSDKHLPQLHSDIEGKSIRERSTSVSSDDSGIASDFDEGFSAVERQLVRVLDKTVGIVGESFDSRYYLSGHGIKQQQQINRLTAMLLEELEPENLPQQLESLLDTIKLWETDKSLSEALSPYNFALRTSILLASEQTGSGILSWDAYTRRTPDGEPLEDKAFWPWVENYKNWVPEAQAVFLKYVETAFIKARNLGQKHPQEMVVAYKGGFGAGKTSHGREAFGLDNEDKPLFAGSIAPDNAKNAIRRALPVSHNTAHLQGSNMAFSLFDGLIKQQGVGTVIYDTSLSRPDDVSDLLRKSEQAGKPLKVVDVTRDDRARLLAVLARGVEGEDPRIPVVYLLAGAQRDREARAECLNVFLPPLPSLSDREESGRSLQHSYEFHCGDAQASNSKRLFTLKYGKAVEWNPELAQQEIESRLLSQGLKFNDESGLFETTDRRTSWSDSLREELFQPVSELVSGLSEGEQKVRSQTFSKRVLPQYRPMAELTIDEAYNVLSSELRESLSLSAFEKSFAELAERARDDLLVRMKEASEQGESLTYMELPTIFALQLNSQLTTTPNCWVK